MDASLPSMRVICQIALYFNGSMFFQQLSLFCLHFECLAKCDNIVADFASIFPTNSFLQITSLFISTALNGSYLVSLCALFQICLLERVVTICMCLSI